MQRRAYRAHLNNGQIRFYWKKVGDKLMHATSRDDVSAAQTLEPIEVVDVWPRPGYRGRWVNEKPESYDAPPDPDPLDDAKPGDGLTHVIYTDHHAMTITRRTETEIYARRDHAKRVDGNGMSECQTYEYAANPDAPERAFTRRTVRRNGRRRHVWVLKGHPAGSPGNRAYAGRHEYYDFSF